MLTAAPERRSSERPGVSRWSFGMPGARRSTQSARRRGLRRAVGAAAVAGAVGFVLFGESLIAWTGAPVRGDVVLQRAELVEAGGAEKPVDVPLPPTTIRQVSAETRTIGSLPAIATGSPVSANSSGASSSSSLANSSPSSASAELPSSLTSALPAWRLRAPVSYAGGAISARPLPRSVSPIRRRAAMTSTATKLAAQQFGGSLRPADVDTFFAEFDAPVGKWLGKVESVETEPRAVWFVVFSGMESTRASGVVVRRRDAANPPTTRSLRVVSDVVVVIDDDTGEVLVASEFFSERTPR